MKKVMAITGIIAILLIAMFTGCIEQEEHTTKVTIVAYHEEVGHIYGGDYFLYLEDITSTNIEGIRTMQCVGSGEYLFNLQNGKWQLQVDDADRDPTDKEAFFITTESTDNITITLIIIGPTGDYVKDVIIEGAGKWWWFDSDGIDSRLKEDGESGTGKVYI